MRPVEKFKMRGAEKIGIVTFQNGIANSWVNFIKSSQITFDQFTDEVW